MRICYPVEYKTAPIKGRFTKCPMDTDLCGFFGVDAIATPIVLTMDMTRAWVTDIAPEYKLDTLVADIQKTFGLEVVQVGPHLGLKGQVDASRIPVANLLGKSAMGLFPSSLLFHELQTFIFNHPDTKANALWLWGKGSQKVDNVVWQKPKKFKECFYADGRLEKPWWHFF